MEPKSEGIMINVNTGWGDSVQVTGTELKPATGTKTPGSSRSGKHRRPVKARDPMSPRGQDLVPDDQATVAENIKDIRVAYFVLSAPCFRLSFGRTP